MNFYVSVKPVILEYMNRAFSATDGYGATIHFDNGLEVFWDFDGNGNMLKVEIDSNYHEAVLTTEEHFQWALELVIQTAKMELHIQEERKKTDQHYKEMLQKIIQSVK